MALIDDVKAICDRLAPLDWRNALLNLTNGQLDIQKPTSAALRTELTKTLTAIDRTAVGFTDFSLTGCKGDHGRIHLPIAFCMIVSALREFKCSIWPHMDWAVLSQRTQSYVPRSVRSGQ